MLAYIAIFLDNFWELVCPRQTEAGLGVLWAFYGVSSESELASDLIFINPLNTTHSTQVNPETLPHTTFVLPPEALLAAEPFGYQQVVASLEDCWAFCRAAQT